ncbi:DUF4833 domain-containing protein [Arcticibacter tournemirensis]|uniref:DUF4833 domain-containing protein n=1 Tax=Arcticibacter tournemirensis TaxID=699437 RepID=A0A4Q0M8J4_9SPHI|nr:DUF4833 domain-containing protein [Arcticibacter tournemirensis]RXF69457.1 DUF4833 domain-containing protein [Arcticibacter tournemirensis]
MSQVPLRTSLQLGIYKIINPLVRFLIKIGLTPNAVTTIGLILNIGVAVIFIMGAEKGNRGDLSFVGWAGALVLFAGLFDMLDGQVARIGNMKSTFGALFDSVLDRYSEMIMFLGVCFYLVSHHYFLSSLFAFIALIGSMMVSYTRARAEGLGIECKGGLMQRPERVVLIGLSAIACGISSAFLGGDYKVFVPGIPFHVFETMSIFTIPITVMAVLTNITAVNRLMDSKKALDLKEKSDNDMFSSKKASVFISFILITGLSAGSADAFGRPLLQKLETVFPTPKGISNQLFYLQRDPNANTIICQLNTDAEGQVDKDNPVNVFWIRYAEKGQKSELNFIQRKFAYGINSKPLGNGKYELKFVSYGKLPLYLMKDKNNRYRVYTTVAKREIILDRIFVRIEGGTFWVPNVKYVELKGVDATTGEDVAQRIKV